MGFLNNKVVCVLLLFCLGFLGGVRDGWVVVDFFVNQ